MPDPLLDTNVFIHAHTTDAHSGECRRLLMGLETGQVRADLDPMVLHELSYALPRYVQQLSRTQIAKYLLMVVGWPGVLGEKAIMIDTVTRWANTPGLSFVDSYLITLALNDGREILTKNVREFRKEGVGVPDPLPSGGQT